MAGADQQGLDTATQFMNPGIDILFVTYGGGHAQMVLPVVRWFRTHTVLNIRVLALTTAAKVFTESGIEVLGFRDFVLPEDEPALALGERLLEGNTVSTVCRDESIAYLGLSYADMERQMGVNGARDAYARFGRQAFRPVGVLKRILKSLSPSVLVATSSPRAERAAIEAARVEGIPAVCMVDLFAIDESAWVGQLGYADRVCVLNQAVADRLHAFGRQRSEIAVTGNPAFDELHQARWIFEGSQLRLGEGWEGRKVVLFASQPEPSEHPSAPGKRGDPALPGEIRQVLEKWALEKDGLGHVVVVRQHPGESVLPASDCPEIVRDGRKYELPSLLHAVDCVVTMNSTVGLQAHLAGKPVIQVLGSMFDDSVPLAAYGMADSSLGWAGLHARLTQVLSSATGRAACPTNAHPSATEAVSRVILQLHGSK